jgi:hypothetical protein
MIVIGADIHKSTHALAAVDAATGVLSGELEVRADEPGHLAALRWARELEEDRVWAIEDCRHLSRRFEQALIVAGERVVRVPPMMMGQSRRAEREPGKSDQIDARAVARAVLREGVERFPAAFLDERALEIRLLADHRSDLVVERTRQINRLRWHLVDLCPDLEAKIPARHLNSSATLDRIARRRLGTRTKRDTRPSGRRRSCADSGRTRLLLDRAVELLNQPLFEHHPRKTQMTPNTQTRQMTQPSRIMHPRHPHARQLGRRRTIQQRFTQPNRRASRILPGPHGLILSTGTRRPRYVLRSSSHLVTPLTLRRPDNPPPKSGGEIVPSVLLTVRTAKRPTKFVSSRPSSVESNLPMPPTDSDGEEQDRATGGETRGRRLGSTLRWQAGSWPVRTEASLFRCTGREKVSGETV